MSNNQVIRWILVAFSVFLGFFAIWLIRDIVLLTLSAVIIAILLTSPVRFFVRFGIPRPTAVALTIVMLFIGVGIVILLLLPGLLDQFSILVSQTIPGAWNLLQKELDPSTLNTKFPFLERLGINLNEVGDQLARQLLAWAGTVTGQVFPFVGVVLTTIISILVVLFLSVYFVADPDTHWRGMLLLVPLKLRPRAREILVRLDLSLRRFLQAQLLLMLLTGLSTGLALAMLNLPLPGALGTITGLFSFVPNFGPVIALIPILAVALINTPGNIWLMIAVFFGIQFVISQIVAPLLLGQEMQLPPAMILLSQIIAGVFFGFLGLLLSVPLAAIVTVLVREIYVRDILGDQDVGQKRTQEMEIVRAIRPVTESTRTQTGTPPTAHP